MLSDVGLAVPELLLPAGSVDMTMWAVVACDQYTSEPDYWERARSFVGASPSTLDLILPECYLGGPDEAPRVSAIHQAMARYLDERLLLPQPPALHVVRRTFPSHPPRTGLLAAIDLERYSFLPGARALVRPTEGTILERIPPRKAIRTAAPIELPHVLVFIDDPGKSVIEPLYREVSASRPVYDFALMMGAGRVTSFRVSDPDRIRRVGESLRALLDPAAFEARHGSRDAFLFAVGDGNHSLAAAKAVWEDVRGRLSRAEAENHPARHALVELVNLHDDGITFEPIHRVLTEVDATDFLAFARATGAGTDAPSNGPAPASHVVTYLNGETESRLALPPAGDSLPVGALQELLDAYLKRTPSAKIDYIHGEESLAKTRRQDRTLCFRLPSLSKGELYRCLVARGVLPRKSFSIGEAHEKRFYVEARRILPEAPTR